MNSVVKMNSEHTTVYHHYGCSNQNLFLVEKPAPRFSFPSEPIPQFHPQEAKASFLMRVGNKEAIQKGRRRAVSCS